MRRTVLARDRYVCQLAYPGCHGRATEADHIVPRLFGGPDTLDNLRAACAHCNRRRGVGLDPPTTPVSVW